MIGISSSSSDDDLIRRKDTFSMSYSSSDTYTSSSSLDEELDEEIINQHPLYGIKEIKNLLLAEWMSCKNQDWTILNYAQIIALNKSLLFKPLFNTDEMIYISQAADDSVYYNKAFTIDEGKGRDFSSIYDGFITLFLKEFKHKLMIAGGCVTRMFLYGQGDETRTDVDFFFIQSKQNEIDEMIIKMHDMIKEKGYNCLIVRNYRTTTIYYSKDDDVDNLLVSGNKFQFIHSYFKSKAHVIGSFDLGCSMIYYDGDDFYSSMFGAFCIATRTVIVDISKFNGLFSFSRIKKYNDYGFGVVFTKDSNSYIRSFNKSFIKVKEYQLSNNTKINIENDVNLVYDDGKGKVVSSYYGGGDYSSPHECIYENNSTFAEDGMWQYISWFGTNIHDVINNPKIKYINKSRIIQNNIRLARANATNIDNEGYKIKRLNSSVYTNQTTQNITIGIDDDTYVLLRLMFKDTAMCLFSYIMDYIVDSMRYDFERNIV